MVRSYLNFSVFLLVMISCQPESDQSRQNSIETLIREFENPPVSARPKGFWCWINGNFDLERITLELEQSKANGMGGYDIWDVSPISDIENKVPAGPRFMGHESTNAIIHAIKEATRLNLELGLMVASSWNSGGSWIPPEYGVMGILDTTIIVNGSSEVSINIPFPNLPEYDAYHDRGVLISKDSSGLPAFYQEIALMARPVGPAIIDTAQYINLDDNFVNGQLTWSVPPGQWEITRYVCTNLGTALKRPSTNSNGLMIDHFSRQAQEFHLQFFIDKLKPKLGDLGNTALKYLYNDSYEIKGPVWTPTMLHEFRQRRGYDIRPFLPVFAGKIVQSQEITDRFLYDFKMTLSDLAVDNHYKFGVDFCQQYGLGYHAEGGGPGPPLHDVPVESIKALGALSVPRGEFWHKYPKYDAEGFDSHWFIKGIASAAHLYDQTFVEAESFTSLLHWQEGWQDLKPTADQAFCEGLNRVVFHTSNHSPDAFGAPGYVYGFGTHMDTRQTWWPKSRAWIDYLARNSYLLQQGNFVGDILYYYGDQAPNFAKQRHTDPSLGFGYDYDVINTEKLLELEMSQGKMTLPHGQEYALLVLPQQNTMPLVVLQKLEQLLGQGALVVGPKPNKTPGLYNFHENDLKLNHLADQLWQGLSENNSNPQQIGQGKLYWGATQRDILRENGIYPDFRFIGQDDSTSLNFIHRRTAEADIYFIRNRMDKPAITECVFRVKGRVPQLWMPETGEVVQDLIYKAEGDSIRIALNFDPHDAFFIIFTPDENKRHRQKVSMNGQTLFPANQAYARMFGYHTRQGRFTEPGNYSFTYNDGTTETKEVVAARSDSLNGTWRISFPHGWGAPASLEMPHLISWTESDQEGVKYFSGIAKYELDFEWQEIEASHRYYLDLGDVRELAEVWLNGHSLGIIWHKPFVLDITERLESGKNHLVLEVANEWNNRLVGDGKLPESERLTNTNIVKGPKAWSDPWAEVPLNLAGVLGPARIIIYPE
ncbi:MAG: glycosyl hydrolase [Candidatus Cyclobacteriaceae bacterium M3_2C_046]